MSLVGTLLFPDPALTRDLAKRCSASDESHGYHLPPPSSDPEIEIKQTPTTTKIDQGGAGTPPRTSATKTTKADQGADAGKTLTSTDSSVELAPAAPTPDDSADAPCPVVSGVTLSGAEETVPVPVAIDDSGTADLLTRATLVTALEFLSPYPLLAGASTGGTVALWRVPDGVCVQVGRRDMLEERGCTLD